MGDKTKSVSRHQRRSGPVCRVFSPIMKSQMSLLLASLWLAWMGTLLVPVHVAFGQSIQLSDSQAEKIGRRLWQNESGGTIAGLTAWNSGEDFASYTDYCFDKADKLVGLRFELRTAWGWGYRRRVVY